MSASNTAGFVGKWGRTSFTALPHGSSVRSVESKFFKSRNARPRPEENSSLGGGSVGVAVRLRPALPEEVVSDGAVEAAPAVDPGEAGEVSLAVFLATEPLVYFRGYVHQVTSQCCMGQPEPPGLREWGST